MRTLFACDLETMTRLAEYERDYQELFSLPADLARRSAIRREIERRWTVARLTDLLSDMTDLSVALNNEAMRGHIDCDLANAAVATLRALSKSFNK